MPMSKPEPNAETGRLLQWACVVAAIAPMALLGGWMYLVRDRAPGVAEFFLGPLLVGGLMVFWLLFLHVVVCRDRLRTLGFTRRGLMADACWGIALGAVFLVLKQVTDPWLLGLFPQRAPSPEIIGLIRAVAGDPLLLALWLGPVVWFGIAGFEELWRVFLLHRLWSLVPGLPGAWLTLFAVSALVGVAHGYQGPAAVVSIGVKSLLMGAFFMYRRRVVPLIVAHAVYDSVQIAFAVRMLGGG